MDGYVLSLGLRFLGTDMSFCNRLNPSEQRELQTRLEKKQMKEFMTVSISLLVLIKHPEPMESGFSFEANMPAYQ